MNTLHVRNLEFWGRHGITGDEKEMAQPFAVSVGVEYDFGPAIQSDKLSDAIDYKVIEAVVKKKIEGGHRVLIETLANDIADTLFAETTAQSVKIHLSKVRAKSPGIPSVILSKVRP